jgi:hypothetical protein
MMLLGDVCMLSDVFFVQTFLKFADRSFCFQHIQVHPPSEKWVNIQ